MVNMPQFNIIINWCNSNSGFLTLVLFLTTLLIGWITGFFAQLKTKPKFRINLLENPTFCCKILTNRKYKEHNLYRTAFVTYLNIINIGTASSSILNVKLGYKTNSYDHILPWKWFWLEQTTALEDFSFNIGDGLKVYPFFTQKNNLMDNETKSFINIGEDKCGIKYFESNDYWGGYEPRNKNNKVKIKIIIEDAFGNKHSKVFQIPIVELNEARKFNSKFGLSRETELKNREQK